MKNIDFIRLLTLGLKNLTYRRGKPVLGTIIITDYCNLSCKHCKVNNINNVMYSYDSIVNDMQEFYQKGIRILFLSGGETMLWEDGGQTIKDLIKKAREIGFILVNLVTNGTITLDVPEADLIFLSLDGNKEHHNSLRGDVWDKIMDNLEKSTGNNITVFMAVNNVNYKDIEYLTEFSKSHKKINGISFNFHTPYHGTEHLTLTLEQKEECVSKIKELLDKRYPIFNLKVTLDNYLKNTWARPCRECVVTEGGKLYVCGRCVAIKGLCENCGYLFPMEFSSIFKGNPRAIFEMINTYRNYV